MHLNHFSVFQIKLSTVSVSVRWHCHLRASGPGACLRVILMFSLCLFGYLGFLLQSVHKLAVFFADSKLKVGVNRCLSVSRVAVWLTRLLPNDSRDRLQPRCKPELDKPKKMYRCKCCI